MLLTGAETTHDNLVRLPRRGAETQWYQPTTVDIYDTYKAHTNRD
jgi:hypothetical protein